MSDGLTDAIREFWIASDKADKDPDDLWIVPKVTKGIDESNQAPKSSPWLDFHNWAPEEYKCTCGSEITYGKSAGHSSWCDAVKS